MKELHWLWLDPGRRSYTYMDTNEVKEKANNAQDLYNRMTLRYTCTTLEHMHRAGAMDLDAPTFLRICLSHLMW